jgi:GH15 family glucan-1,4-alpha-glucosidase
MARPVMLGNGSLTVGLNQQGMVHDFYYPYVGLDNLATSRRLHHKIGVWVDDKFSWVDDGSWKIKVDFETEALVSKVHFVNTKLNIRLELSDFVDYEHNILFRKLKYLINLIWPKIFDCLCTKFFKSQGAVELTLHYMFLTKSIY